MEDIDQFILNMRMDDAIQNYVKNNVFPDLNTLFLKPGEKPRKKPINKYLDNNYTSKNNEQTLLDIIYPNTISPLCNSNDPLCNSNDSIYNEINSMKNKLKKLDNILEECNKENIEQQNQCCPICYEKVSEKNKFIGKCDHKFCFDCIDTLKKSSHANNNCCPICRFKLF